MSAPLRDPRNDLQPGRQLIVDEAWRDDLHLRIDDLCAITSEYLEPAQVEQLHEACHFAAEAHAGIYRKSGEPYIFHPLAVARILANVRFDHETLQAALLHDVIEDTHYNKEHLSSRFGPEVADLVDGVSKLTQIQFNSKLEAQAENFRKMFLAMANDLRVIMIKLADRLHNMRTLGAMRPESRRRIARETLEIYAPIAGRLGMNHLRQELEDLGFKSPASAALSGPAGCGAQAERQSPRDHQPTGNPYRCPVARRKHFGPGDGARQALVGHLPEDAGQAPAVPGSPRCLRRADYCRYGGHLLSGAGGDAQPVQADHGPVQGLRRHSQSERLSVAAYRAVWPQRRSH